MMTLVNGYGIDQAASDEILGWLETRAKSRKRKRSESGLRDAEEGGEAEAEESKAEDADQADSSSILAARAVPLWKRVAEATAKLPDLGSHAGLLGPGHSTSTMADPRPGAHASRKKRLRRVVFLDGTASGGATS